jgi:hypothetical protein
MVDDQPAEEHPVARGHTIKIERDATVFNPLDFYDGVIRADRSRLSNLLNGDLTTFLHPTPGSVYLTTGWGKQGPTNIRPSLARVKS